MKEIVPELAVQDLAGAEAMLMTVFGFARDGDLLRLHDQRIALVQAYGPRGHGGIDHLALSVNDTDAALADLLTRGAVLEETTPDGPKEIAEFWANGVRYVFLQGPEGARIELCAKRDTPAEAHRPGHDHIGIPCTDIAATAAFFTDLGAKPVASVDLIRAEGTIAVRFLSAGQSVIELYSPPGHDPASLSYAPLWRGLRVLGTGRTGTLTGPDGLQITLL
jgi:catechol 2,3-dioxygenase-like lactoylglutathione lyase family enzyme